MSIPEELRGRLEKQRERLERMYPEFKEPAPSRWVAFTDDELETLADRFVNETYCYSIDPPEELHDWEKSLLDEIETEQNQRKRDDRKRLQRAGVLPA